MRKIVKRYHPPGTPPGTLIPPAEGATPARIRLLEYTAESCKEIAVQSLDDCLPYLKTPAATWIHIQGTPSPAMLKQLGQNSDSTPWPSKMCRTPVSGPNSIRMPNIIS